MYCCGLAMNLITISLILDTRCESTSNMVLLQLKSRALCNKTKNIESTIFNLFSKCKNESDEDYMWFGVTLENSS
jgi:hypothetical protein